VARRTWYNSASKFQCATLLELGLHYQRASLKNNAKKTFTVACLKGEIASLPADMD
jgi:hypothetical protein